MGEALSRKAKKEIMKDIILQLHKGLSVEVAKNRFEKEVGAISSTEIAEIEQTLINEGLSPEEIKKFCNVHALIFQSSLEKVANEETSPSHPVYLFKLENREIEKLTAALKKATDVSGEYELVSVKQKLNELLERLKGINTHYERKEQLLFPFLEKQGFMGPSKVMWGKDNEIRDMLKVALNKLETARTKEDLDNFRNTCLSPLIEEIAGMIFKEENILFPIALEKLSASDWVDILRESDDVGYVFIERPQETAILIRELKTALLEEPFFQDSSISFPTGTIHINELMSILNTLPLDITFVDKDDTVKYFSEGKGRVFRRTKSVIGRKVQNCHPPQSIEEVEKIISSFRSGERDSYEFWIKLQGRLVHIRYFALRDNNRHYLGVLEVTQDITEIKKLEGEKRLLDERD